MVGIILQNRIAQQASAESVLGTSALGAGGRGEGALSAAQAAASAGTSLGCFWLQLGAHSILSPASRLPQGSSSGLQPQHGKYRPHQGLVLKTRC